jgi:hypothetical protein
MRGTTSFVCSVRFFVYNNGSNTSSFVTPRFAEPRT